jgi:uroporphyrinogen decarboxylase
MSEHIEVVKRAIEFGKPAYLPMEIVDVPGIYNAYHTLDPETVRFIPGTENFDALWPCCYSLLHKEVARTAEGMPIKVDQWGTRLKTPPETNSAYVLLSHPLTGKNSLEGYAWPDPDDMDPLLNRLGQVVREHYPDRFVDGFIDAGLFLTTQFLFGLEEFLLKVAENPDLVTEAYERVTDYYMRLVPKFKRAGAHMITVIEDIGGHDGLVLNPNVWRKRFKPITQRFIDHVHAQGLYAGIAIDGSSREVLDDLIEMKVDVFSVFDIKTTGLETIRRKLGGKMCVKAAVDMQTTLALGSPEAVAREADELVKAFHTPQGGFIAQATRWHRPEFPAANVQASVQAFNRYRKGGPGHGL